MITRVIIVHGWQGVPEENWLPWLKKELIKRGIKVVVPSMPDANFPTKEKWVNHLAKIIGNPDSNCYIVGYSLACIAILRYLESLEKKEMIGGVIFVAGFPEPLGIKEHETFFQTKLNFNKIKSHCSKFIAIHSDDDPYVPITQGEILRDKLEAKLIIMSGLKHFSSKTGTYRLPVVLESVVKLTGR